MGHQFSNWATAFTLAKQYGLTFVHQPIRIWDDFLGFGIGEVQYDSVKQLPLVVVPLLNFETDEGHARFKQVVDSTPDNTLLHLYSDQHSANLIGRSVELRDKYWRNRANYPVDVPWSGSSTNIAVHVRRGDLMNWTPEERAGRFLPNEYFIKILRGITQGVAGYEIHVFSQSDEDGVREFNELPHVFYHLNGNDFEAFHALAGADILLVSKSGFSYLAGIVNKGIKYAPPDYWSKIPEGWIR